MIMIRFTLLALFLHLPVSFAQAEPPASSAAVWLTLATKLNLSEAIEWQRLVHYEKGLFGGIESLADAPRFFTSPEGKTNPSAELSGTLSAFFAPVTDENLRRERIVVMDEPSKEVLQAETNLRQHAICQFPARLAYLKRALRWDGSDLPKIECKRYAQFRRRLSADGVSLVFSSFYLGSPSSTFGHTLLRFHNSSLPLTQSAGVRSRSELLDTGVNYAANPTVTNPLLYSIFGLAGLFPGTFTAVPYYYKVREYNSYEARDLWSYQLDLTPDEIDRLAAHLFEEGSTYYDYFYFTENCATHMLNLLDAAAPRLHLRDHMPYYVIPSATVHALFQEKGFVKERTYRPSVRREFFYRWERLDANQKDRLDRLISGEEADHALEGLRPIDQVQVLDTWSDYIEFKFADAIQHESAPALALKRDALLTRSKIRLKSDVLSMPPPEDEAPERAHGVRRLQIGTGYSDLRKGYTSVDWRFAMHDSTDATEGYPPNTTVEFFTARANFYWPRHSFELEELRLFQIESITPVNHFETPMSYAADLHYHRRYDRDFSGDGRGGYAEFKAGSGVTLPLGNRAYTAGILFLFAGQYSPQFTSSNVRLSGGPHPFFLLNFSHRLKWMAEIEPEWRLPSQHAYRWEGSSTLKWTFARAWAASVTASASTEEARSSFGLQTYF